MDTDSLTDAERDRLVRRIKDMLLLSSNRLQVRVEEYGRYPILISLEDASDVPPVFYPRLTYSFNVGDNGYARTKICLFVDLKGWDAFHAEVENFIRSLHHSIPLTHGYFGLSSNEDDRPDGYTGYGCEIPLDYSAVEIVEKLIDEIDSVFFALGDFLPDWSAYYRKIKKFSAEKWVETRHLANG